MPKGTVECAPVANLSKPQPQIMNSCLPAHLRDAAPLSSLVRSLSTIWSLSSLTPRPPPNTPLSYSPLAASRRRMDSLGMTYLTQCSTIRTEYDLPCQSVTSISSTVTCYPMGTSDFPREVESVVRPYLAVLAGHASFNIERARIASKLRGHHHASSGSVSLETEVCFGWPEEKEARRSICRNLERIFLTVSALIVLNSGMNRQQQPIIVEAVFAL